MDRQDLVHDPLEILFTEQVVHDDTEIIGGVAVFILCLHQFRSHLIIFNDRGSAVLEAHDADLFIGRGLADGLCAAGASGGDRSSDKYRVRDPLQHVVDRESIEPLNAQLMYLVDQACALHREEPPAIAVGGGGDPAFCLHVDLAVIIRRRGHFLFEEKDLGGIIAEIIHFFHKTDGLVVVLVTRHDKERDKDPAGLVDDIHEVGDKALHDIDGVGESDVIHAFGVIRSKTGSHASGQKNSGDFSLPHCLQTDLVELFPASCDLIKFHRGDRGNIFLLCCCVLVLHILKDGKIRLLHLLKELRFLSLIELIIIFQDMKLSIFFQFPVCFLVSHDLLLHYYRILFYPALYLNLCFYQCFFRVFSVFFVFFLFSAFAVFSVFKTGILRKKRWRAQRSFPFWSFFLLPQI